MVICDVGESDENDVKVENITMKSEGWDLNMYVRSRTHDVSSQSMQAL